MKSELAKYLNEQTELLKKTQKLERLAKWLTDCHCENVKPCRVTIGKEFWEGCEYQQRGTYAADMDCVRNGQHKAGETYLSNRRIYLIGQLPKVYERRRNNCFQFDNGEWYLSGYIVAIKPEFALYHPFGPNFSLAHWDITDKKLDDGERFPYYRFQMTVEFCA